MFCLDGAAGLTVDVLSRFAGGILSTQVNRSVPSMTSDSSGRIKQYGEGISTV